MKYSLLVKKSSGQKISIAGRPQLSGSGYNSLIRFSSGCTMYNHCTDWEESQRWLQFYLQNGYRIDTYIFSYKAMIEIEINLCSISSSIIAMLCNAGAGLSS